MQGLEPGWGQAMFDALLLALLRKAAELPEQNLLQLKEFKVLVRRSFKRLCSVAR